MQTPQRGRATVPGTVPKSVRKSVPDRGLPPVLVGASVRAAAQSAVLAGLQPITIDEYRDSDTRSLAAKSYQLSPRTDDGPARLQKLLNDYKRHPVFACGGWTNMLTQQAIGFPTNQSFAKARSPELIDEVTKRFGFAEVGGVSGAELAADSGAGSGRTLIKDRSTSGGLGVRWDRETRLPDDSNVDGSSVDGSLTPSQYRQRWLPGRSCGACFVTNGRQTIWLGATRCLHRRMGDLPFVYCGSVGPIPIEASVRSTLTRAAEWIAVQCDLRGCFNIDFLLQDPDRLDGSSRNSLAGSAVILEVNPRWTASCEVLELDWMQNKRFRQECRSLFGLSHGLAFGDEMPDWLESSTKQRANRESYRWYKRVVFASREFRFHRDSMIDLMASPHRVADIPCDGTIIKPNEPICTIVFDRNEATGSQIRSTLRTIARSRLS